MWNMQCVNIFYFKSKFKILLICAYFYAFSLLLVSDEYTKQIHISIDMVPSSPFIFCQTDYCNFLLKGRQGRKDIGLVLISYYHE